MSTQRYFAVRIGRRPGIYPSLDMARREGIVDHPNAQWRSFRSLADATNYLRDVLPQHVLSNQRHNEEQIAHPDDHHPLPAPSLSPPPSAASAPPPYSQAGPELDRNVDVVALLSFVAANGLVHADSIPPGRERGYQQDSILSSYYRPINQPHTGSVSALGDDESQDSAISTESNSSTSAEFSIPDRDSRRNALEGGPEPIPDTGSVPLFLGMRGVFCEDYVFRLIGAPEDGGVDMHAVEAVVGRHAYHYMLGHYFTRGSMHVVAASYSQHRNNRLAFVAALMHRGLAPKIIGYLWHLVSYAGEQPDSEGIQINSNGSADARLAVEDDAVDSTNADE